MAYLAGISAGIGNSFNAVSFTTADANSDTVVTKLNKNLSIQPNRTYENIRDKFYSLNASLSTNTFVNADIQTNRIMKMRMPDSPVFYDSSDNEITESNPLQISMANNVYEVSVNIKVKAFDIDGNEINYMVVPYKIWISGSSDTYKNLKATYTAASTQGTSNDGELSILRSSSFTRNGKFAVLFYFFTADIYNFDRRLYFNLQIGG